MTSSPCQTGAFSVTAPPRPVFDGSFLRRFAERGKDMLLGFVLSLFVAVIVRADEMPQGWVPEVLVLPEDAEVQMDRAIGSSIRMFSFKTGADVESLFEDWSSALEGEGYSIRRQQSELEGTAIEFSGGHILNAKIAIEAASTGERVVITLDATLQ
jgi:hypothetical protein